jgi:hypothetical protein
MANVPHLGQGLQSDVTPHLTPSAAKALKEGEPQAQQGKRMDVGESTATSPD